MLHSENFSKSEKELRLVIDNLPSMIAYIDASKKFSIINRAYHDYFEVNEDEVIGKHVRDVIGENFYKIISRYIETALSGKSTVWESHHSDEDGKESILSNKLVPYIDTNGDNNGYLMVIEDVTGQKQLQLQLEALNRSLEEKVEWRTRQLQKELVKRKELEKHLRKLADHDSLTGLLNRRSFVEKVDYEVSRCRRYNGNLSYMIIDIDKFKSINDTYGHLIGDEVLKGFSKKMLSVLRETDFIGRIGGEEFAVALPDTSPESANKMAERIRQQLAEYSVCHKEETLSFTVSIGVSNFTAKEENIEEVFNRADTALYKAKNSGRNKVCVAA